MADKYNFSDVMISYSREDKVFVRTLDAAFREMDDEVWVDWEDIKPTEDGWEAIAAGIEAASTFVFVISPDSVRSGICRRELGHALNHNKRIVPILFRTVNDDDQQVMHPTLRRHHWIDFQEESLFNDSFLKLRTALRLDLNNLREHTRLLVRAREWEQQDKPRSLLLRGDDLRRSHTWLLNSHNSDPAPTDIQTQFISTSVKAVARQRRILAISSTIILLVLATALLFRVYQTTIARQALDAKEVAFAEREIAIGEAATANIEATNAFQEVQIAETELAVLEANAAIQQDEINTQIAQVTALNATAVHAGNVASTRSVEVATAFVAVTEAQYSAQVAQGRLFVANQTSAAGQLTVESVMGRLTQVQSTLDRVSTSAAAIPQTQNALAVSETAVLATQAQFVITQAAIADNIVFLEETEVSFRFSFIGVQTQIPCSWDSTVSTQITFRNIGQETAGIYWRDYSCNLRLYTTLNPGQSYTQNTYATHPWIIRNCATGEEHDPVIISVENAGQTHLVDANFAASVPTGSYCNIPTAEPPIAFPTLTQTAVPTNTESGSTGFTSITNTPMPAPSSTPTLIPTATLPAPTDTPFLDPSYTPLLPPTDTPSPTP